MEKIVAAAKKEATLTMYTTSRKDSDADQAFERSTASKSISGRRNDKCCNERSPSGGEEVRRRLDLISVRPEMEALSAREDLQA